MAKELQGTEGRVFEEYLSEDDIKGIVSEVAKRITADYEGCNPLFICVLNGAYIYAADLYRAIPIRSEITFVRLKSYEGTSTTGHVELVTPLIEDIVDTGTTMHYFKQMLREMGAKSVAVTAFLFKPEALLYPDAEPEYVGKSIPRKFVLGYGLDYDGYGRNLSDIYIATE